MEFSIWNIFAPVFYTQCFVGITVNLIIVAAKIKKWKTLKSLPTCDKILTCLVVSRSLSIFNVFLGYLLSQLNPLIILNLVITMTLLTIARSLYYTNLWFATVLCVFYCVKITSYNWKFFIFLKTKISTLVPRFLLTSLIISISSSCLFSLYFLYNLKLQNVSNSSIHSITVNENDIVLNFYNQFLIFLLGSCPPFLIFCVTICLLLHSLWMHTRRMRSSGSGFRSPNLETHFSAVKSMSFFLVLQMTYFVFINILYSGILQDNTVLRLSSLVVTCSTPFLHSLYMICSSNEIKKEFIALVCGCGLRQTLCAECQSH